MSHLLKPLNEGKLVLKNRLVMPPMATSKSEKDGTISKDILDYYDEKSKGGFISLIVIEHSFITGQGRASEGQLSVADDSIIKNLKSLSSIIHKNGSKTVMQINHAGSATSKSVTGYEPVGPSAIANPRTSSMPKELTKEDIKGIIEEFKNAALRVKEAGFDGVEIHSAHGYLLNQFYSPLTNKTTDEYGGDLLSRIKIHLEIIKAVRHAVGEDFPILLRLGASDYIEGGSTIEESKIAAVEFEKAGIDILDISGGFCGFIVPGLTEQGYFSSLTEEIKRVVSIPVILTGGITSVDAADKLIFEEKADLIGVGRAIYKDSKWAEKAINHKSYGGNMKGLFDNTAIRNMNLKNRFLRSATWEAMADSKGHMTEKLYNVYENLAKGGVGAIITGYAFVTENEQPNPGMMGIYDDSFIEEYKEFTDKIHKFDTNIILQIAYGGSQTNFNVGKREILGPSAVAHRTYGVTPKEATKEDIKYLVNSFAEASLRAKKSGFDGVQFHGAHGYIYSQFLSPHYNKRTDEYGGNIENRARIVFDTLIAVREKVGADFPVMIKINCSDFIEDGFTFEECKYVCKRLEELGIDAIEISGVVGTKSEDITVSKRGLNYLEKESCFRKYAAEIAENANVPIILVGVNRHLEVMNDILNTTKIEYFSLSRPFLREPDLINRWSGEDNSKATCISCGKCGDVHGNSCIFNRKK